MGWTIRCRRGWEFSAAAPGRLRPARSGDVVATRRRADVHAPGGSHVDQF